MVEIVILGLLLPFLGTAVGAGSVLFMKKGVGKRLNDVLAGFAAGVMTAASVWSLLIPALESASGENRFLAFLPAAAGFICGMALLFATERFIARAESGAAAESEPRRNSTRMLVIAVTLHNFPEGLAVGVAVAGFLEGAGMTAAAVTALAAGIAIQNIPEGSIISLPLYSRGKSKPKSFVCGLFSGAVELFGAVVTLILAHLIAPAMPFLLSLAAGAMIYVVIEELVPEFRDGEGIHFGTVSFAVGFVLMMALDVMLG